MANEKIPCYQLARRFRHEHAQFEPPILQYALPFLAADGTDLPPFPKARG